jgi:hypothetical protein
MTWIVTLLIELWDWFKENGAETASKTFDVIADVGGGLADSLVDWFNDDDVSFYEKLAGIGGLGFAIAPGFTQDVIDNVIEGVGDTTTKIVKTTDQVATSIFSTTTGKVLIFGGLAFLAVMALGD